MKRKDAVVFVFYNPKVKKFLMEERVSGQVFSGHKVFPGGKVEDFERDVFTKTLIRESLEELGVKPLKFFGFEKPVIGETGYNLWVYLITKWFGSIPEIVQDKGSRLIWVSEGEFESKLVSVNQIFNQARNFIVSHNVDTEPFRSVNSICDG